MGNSAAKPVFFTDDVNLSHFRLLRVVGKGAFGKVRIVERKDTGLTFALKYIRKDEVVRSESVRNIIRERRMLEMLNHPFLCNLRYSFQDVEYLYLVQDLMNGGDLRFHISRKTLTEEAVRFWMAELACALRYIHKQGIVHRDVKPDNVLLDSEGHVHLADFNVASEFRRDKKLHSKSGTLAYLAPEVYAGMGYMDEVDWWSLGVTFYECIYNRRPFEAHNHEKLEKEIIRAMPNYPVTLPPVSMPCLHAISSLIEKDVTSRIGAISFETFVDNPFFRALDFDLLEQKLIPPIFVPSREKTNFDATYDLEELLLEEAPLEARARRQKPRAQLKDDASQKEIRDDELYRTMDMHFEPFDYTLAPFDPNDNIVPETVPDTVGSASASISTRDESPTNVLRHAKSVTSDDHRSLATAASASPPVPAFASPALPHSKSADYFGPVPVPAPTPLNAPKGTAATAGARNRGGSRTAPKSGGTHLALGEPGGWFWPTDKNVAGPAEGGDKSVKSYKSGGFLGLFTRKGRAKSPKPREPGVLGKEGARVIIGGR